MAQGLTRASSPGAAIGGGRGLGGGCEVKFWLDAEVTVAASRGIDARTVRRLRAVVMDRREIIEGAWREYFG